MSASSAIVERAPDPATWEGWLAIDEHERRAGEPDGRPRSSS